MEPPSGGGGGGGGASSSGSPPHVDSFTSPATDENNGLVQVSARISDPDGPGDLAGGVVRLEPNGTVLTSFTGSAGVYAAAFDWGDIQPYQDISFPQGGSKSVSLEAAFYDHGGHEVVRAFSVELLCRTASAGRVGACSSVCRDMSTDASNCGACGNDCFQRWHNAGTPADGHKDISCEASACTLRIGDMNHRASCASACGAIGLSCGSTTCNGSPGTACSYYTFENTSAGCSTALIAASCNTTPPATLTTSCFGTSGFTADWLVQACTCQ